MHKCTEHSGRWLLTVLMVTGPGTWLLSHGEQGVGDVREQAVQVEHVGLHRRGLGLLVHLIRPFLQLGLADLTLEQICQSLKKQFKANFLSISDLSIRGLPTKKKKKTEKAKWCIDGIWYGKCQKKGTTTWERHVETPKNRMIWFTCSFLSKIRECKLRKTVYFQLSKNKTTNTAVSVAPWLYPANRKTCNGTFLQVPSYPVKYNSQKMKFQIGLFPRFEMLCPRLISLSLPSTTKSEAIFIGKPWLSRKLFWLRPSKRHPLR